MNKETFWKIIDEVNATVPSDDYDRIVEATQNKLREYSEKDIAIWANYLWEYNDLADTSGIYAASSCLNDGMSDDGFTDFRTWLISRGKAVYLEALENPDSLAKSDLPFNTTAYETYGYVATDAYEDLNMGGDYYNDIAHYELTDEQMEDIRADIKYYPHEVTCDNLPEHLPELYKQYSEQGREISYTYGAYNSADHNAIAELDKLLKAAKLIETLTNDPFSFNKNPEAESEHFLAIRMKTETVLNSDKFKVRFDVELTEAGKNLNADTLMPLILEGSSTQAIMQILTETEYNPTQQDLDDFNKHLLEQQEPSEGIGMNQQLL